MQEPLRQNRRFCHLPLQGRQGAHPVSLPCKGRCPAGAEGFMAGILYCSFNFLLHEQSCWAAKPPLCKGRCQRQLTEGLMQSSLPFAVQIPTAPCPKIQQLIIGSRILAQPLGNNPPVSEADSPLYTKGPWCGGTPLVRWKIADAAPKPLSQRLRPLTAPASSQAAYPSFPPKGEKLRSLPSSSFPHRTR